MSTPVINYTATPTGIAFHGDETPVRMILGPVAGGKTVMAVMEVMRKIVEQEPDDQKVRRTRFVIIRQSYPQLISTVIKTFEDWLGPLGVMTFGIPITWRARFALPDGTTVDTEVMFMALERAEDATKLRSLEVSHAMISEAAEIPIEILTMLRSRVGRFPAKKDGVECTNPSIWMESNPPPVRSHWYQLFEVQRPDGFRMFRQPPALLYDPTTKKYSANPLAENVENLPGGFDYYFRQIPGNDQSWIDVYILGQYGAVHAGQRIYEMYDDNDHCAPEVLRPVTKDMLVIGMDFGLNAAAVITQMSQTGALHALGEVCGEDMMFEQYLDEQFRPYLASEFFNWPVMVVGDPSDNSGRAAYTMLRDRKIAAHASVTNDPTIRQDAVKWFLNRRGGFLLSPACEILREGFLGGYAYKKTAAAVDAAHTGKADKNHTSHPHDALQYAAIHYRNLHGRPKRPPKRRKKHLWA